MTANIEPPCAECGRGPRDGREAVAIWMMTHGYATGHGDTIEDLLGELVTQVRESIPGPIEPSFDLVIVSMHEKGFSQADFYRGAGDMDMSEFNDIGAVPDDYITLSRGDAIEAAMARAETMWPWAKIVRADDEDEDDEDEDETAVNIHMGTK